MFETVIEKFDKYIEKKESEAPIDFNEDSAIEVRKRLRQLDYLYNLVMKKHSRYWDLHWEEYRDLEALKKRVLEAGGEIVVPKTDRAIEMEQLSFEIETHTESFYYLFGRMRTVIKHPSAPLPELKSFEAVGARNVRNKLLEHAEGKDSGVLVQSFGLGGEKGPTLKVQRPEGQENIFPDEGLEANAIEINDSLDRLLDRALS